MIASLDGVVASVSSDSVVLKVAASATGWPAARGRWPG